MLEHIILAALGLTTLILGWRIYSRPPVQYVVTEAPAPVPAPEPENSLKPAKDALESPISEKSTFLAAMSHEIRTPMNGVIGFAELLLETDLDALQRKQVSLIADSGRAMLRLLNDILDVAKIETGQIRLISEATDLRQKLRHCVNLLEPSAQAKGLKISLFVDDGIPDLVELDRMRIGQIVLNLIGNSIKYTEEGGVDVEVRQGKSSGGPHLLISVIDTGCGMTEKKQQAIFTPFTKGAGRLSRTNGGSGLGLTISSQLVKMMDGEITLESKIGLGSNFTIRLPLRPISDNAATGEARETNDPHETGKTGEQQSALPVPHRSAKGLKGCHVLIAEDHEINQQLIMAMVTSLGMHPELATNGHEAIEAVVHADEQGYPFQIVLMDMQMPEMDGLVAARHLRAIGFSSRDLPIIALTANCFPDDIALCKQSGMQAHLSKPVTVVELAHEISSLLQRNQKLNAQEAQAEEKYYPQGDSSSGTIYDLESKYQQRKDRLLQQIGQSLENEEMEADWDDITSELHKLAGVAANFGDEKLGDISRGLEEQLKSTSQPAIRRQLLARKWDEFKAAA